MPEITKEDPIDHVANDFNILTNGISLLKKQGISDEDESVLDQYMALSLLALRTLEAYDQGLLGPDFDIKKYTGDCSKYIMDAIASIRSHPKYPA